MSLLVLRIRDGGFFVGPKRWLVDHGTHYDFQLGLVRRRIFKSSIDSFYELPGGYAVVAVPLLAVGFLAWGLVRLACRGVFLLVRAFLRL